LVLPRPRWLPPALLLAVALNQLRLVVFHDLTPWCGGGFGMFSTTDGRGARFVRAVALGPGLRIELPVPPELEERAQAAAALPSPAALRALARELAPHASSEFEEPERIRVEVFTTRFEGEELSPSPVLLRALEVPARAP
jgi:hypothetical protein